MALLCLGALPLWIIGVPGNPESNSPYYRGWMMGLNAIIVYPCVFVGLLVVYFVGRAFLGESSRVIWEQGAICVFFVAVLGLVILLVQAFSIMS